MQAKNEPRTQVFNLNEVAARLNLSRWTIARDIARGRLTSYKVGHHVIVYADDLNEYVLRWRGGVGIEA